MIKQLFSYLAGASYRNRTELEKWLLLSCFFSIGLVAVRVVYAKQWTFVFLLWNLFLAFVPYFLTRSAMRRPQWIESNGRFALLFAAWLAFIPNSFYIITDLFHLEERKAVPLWFDLALIFSFSWNGLLLGLVSLRQMELIVRCKWPTLKEWQFVYPMMLLNAFGIYIGRYLRYNSWDVITNPFQLTEDVLYLLAHPLRNRFDWSMILCYAVFMSLVYVTIKKTSQSFGS
jgi:uncharacterized membrane protein